MGIKPVETSYCVNCTLCWPVGETPCRLHLTLGGIQTGTAWVTSDLPPPNGTWIIPQSGVNPCTYQKADLIAVTGVIHAAGWTICSFQRPASPNSFYHQNFSVCANHFTNVFQNPAGKFFGGWAVVTTPAKILSAVEKVMTVFPETVKFELSPGPDPITDIRVADKPHSQNIIIQVDADELK